MTAGSRPARILEWSPDPIWKTRNGDTLTSVNVHTAPRDLLAEAVETAESVLRTGGHLAPFIITDRWGDARVEKFDTDALTDGKAKFWEFVHGTPGAEARALVYIGRVGLGEEAIVIERGQAGTGEAEVFVQHFRPRRNRFRGFKLSGQPTPVGTSE
jgi:hypothetical protein